MSLEKQYEKEHEILAYAFNEACQSTSNLVKTKKGHVLADSHSI
jgi:hypothetical protein